MSRTPPESVTSAAVTIRRWHVADAAALDEMIAASVEHLRPWMPWVRDEPLSADERADKIIGWVKSWDAGESFTCAIVEDAGGLLGTCGLRRPVETRDCLAIGYWVRAGRTGEGIATAAVRALIEAGFSVDGIDSLEIVHDAANTASARVPEKVGFIRVSESPVEPSAPGEVGIDVTWRLHRQQR